MKAISGRDWDGLDGRKSLKGVILRAPLCGANNMMMASEESSRLPIGNAYAYNPSICICSRFVFVIVFVVVFLSIASRSNCSNCNL